MNHLASILQPREKPKASDLLDLMRTSVSDSSDFLGRMEKNDRVKNCWWDGQSEDGRKHEEDICEAAVPWEGASDQRVQLARMLCREEKLVCSAAMVGGRMQAEPVDSASDPAVAAAQTPLLKWLFSGPMRQEMRDETDFLLDWRATFGHSVLAIDWHQVRQLRSETLTNDQLMQLAIEASLSAAGLPDTAGLSQLAATGEPLPPEIEQSAGVIIQQTAEQMLAALLDPERTDRLVALVGALINPEGQTALSVPLTEVRRMVTALQKGEPAVYYRPWLKEDRPKWTALCPWVDVFYPTNVTRLSDSPWIARVHWLTESRLRDRAEMEGWDEEWLEKVLKHPGNSYTELLTRGSSRAWVLGGSAVRRGSLTREENPATRSYQVIELFQTASSQAGVPTLYRTVLHGAVTDCYAIHEPVAEAMGQYGFVEFRRQREDSRYLMDAMGIPEEVMTNQYAIKAQHDARTNRTDLELMPPAFVPMNQMGGSFVLAPMEQIPVRRSGPIEYMKPPPMSMDSVAITREEWALVNQMYGRWSDDVAPPLIQLHMGKTTSDFLTDLSRACQLTRDLCVEYYDETTWMRITGMPKPAPDPYRQDVMISFDVRNLSMEWLQELMALYTNFVVPNDAEGVVDRAEFVSYLFSAINPQVAQRVIKPKEAAAQSEYEDELTQLSIIMGGAEPPQKQGQNYSLRLKVLQTFIATSTEIQGKLQSNEQIRAVMQARIEFFKNQLQQAQNAIIGRTMQQPVYGGGAAA